MKRNWPVIVALLLIYIAVFFDLNFVWGFLFLFWTIPSIYTREIHLVQTVTRKDSPMLYWVILFTWVALSILMITADLPKLVAYFSLTNPNTF